MYKWTVTHRRRGRSTVLADVTPFAGLIFLLIFPFALTGKMRVAATGVVTDEQLPFAHQQGVCSVRGDFGSVIGLSHDGRLSFSMPESPPRWQWVVIAKVASRHGIELNALQLAALQNMPYLAINIRELPKLLALPSSQRDSRFQSGNYSPLTASQFLDCLTEARNLLRSKNQPYYIGVKIDATTSLPQVFMLTDLLQSQGINRFSLMTQREVWSKIDWLVYSNRI